MNTDPLPLGDDDATPVPRSPAELPSRDIERAREIARALNCVLAEDIAIVSRTKLSTAEAWAKRGEGPDYVMFGNARLYPIEALAKFLRSRQRSRSTSNSGSLL